MRIEKHPILEFKQREKIYFTFDGKEVYGYAGDTIASALDALGVKVVSRSPIHDRARGFYCAIGNCGSCHMVVNGVPNVKTCITRLEPGMNVNTQKGKGQIR